MERTRLYGETLKKWSAVDVVTTPGGKLRDIEITIQYELSYTDYDPETGRVIGRGSEDFSADRYREIDTGHVYTWDGKSYNKGGRRHFEYHGSVRYNLNEKRRVFALLRTFHKDAALVQLRTF